MSEEAFQIAVKGSERQRRKGKTYRLNVEFQRIARRDKKAFLSDQCKEIEENNRMGKFTYHQVQADCIQSKTITQASSRYGTSIIVYYICIYHEFERTKGHSSPSC